MIFALNPFPNFDVIDLRVKVCRKEQRSKKKLECFKFENKLEKKF
jgi:hypothetical protein